MAEPIDFDQIGPFFSQRVPDEVAQFPMPAWDAMVLCFESAPVCRLHLGSDQLDLLAREPAAMRQADRLLEVGRGAVAVVQIIPIRGRGSLGRLAHGRLRCSLVPARAWLLRSVRVSSRDVSARRRKRSKDFGQVIDVVQR